jgi:hypothetical protein
MADSAAQSALVDSFDDDRREVKTRDLNAADQSVDRGCQRGFRLSEGIGGWRPDARRAVVIQQAVEIAALLLLENPGIQQDERAVAQECDAGDNQGTLIPP